MVFTSQMTQQQGQMTQQHWWSTEGRQVLRLQSHQVHPTVITLI